MKQRIVKRTYENGNVWYAIQVRFMWFWTDLDTSAHTNSFETLDEAKAHLWIRQGSKIEVVYED